MKTDEKFWKLQRGGVYLNGIRILQKQPIQLLGGDLKTNIMQAYNNGCIGLEDDYTTIDENGYIGSLDERELINYIKEYTTDIDMLYNEYHKTAYHITVKHSDLEKIANFYKKC